MALPTRNNMLWLVKKAWLDRYDDAFQVFIQGAVADWLDEAGNEEEASALRSGRWVLWYLAPTNSYQVKRPGERPDPTKSYPVMWWPIAVCGANSERYTDSLGRPVGPMPDRTEVQGV